MSQGLRSPCFNPQVLTTPSLGNTHTPEQCGSQYGKGHENGFLWSKGQEKGWRDDSALKAPAEDPSSIPRSLHGSLDLL